VSLLVTGVAVGQVVGANEVIPVPAPTSDRGRWTDGPGRLRVETEVNGVKLRGWDYKAEPTAVAQAEMMRGQRGVTSHGSELSKRSEGPITSTAAAGTVADRSVPVVVFFNGNLMTIDRSDELYRRLTGLGLEVVAYDYRGYGFSDGQPDVGSFRTDALAIFDKVEKEYAGRPLLVYGFSLGTAMAAYVASERKVHGVVLAAPFATAEEELPVFARRLGFGAEAIRTMVPAEDAKLAFNEVGMMRRSSAPLLVMSGTSDMLVPAAQGRRVMEASAATVKRFVELRGVQHHETVFVSAAWQALVEFLRKL